MSDKKQFELLFAQYSRLVRSHLYRLGARFPEIDDLTQEVFIKVWRARDDLNAIVAKKAWLLKIATNTAYDFGRKRKLTYVEDVDQDFQHQINTELSGEDIDLKKIAEMALQILTWEQRTTVILFYFEDFTMEEIALEQNIPIGTVKSRLNISREKMQDFLSRKGIKLWTH